MAQLDGSRELDAHVFLLEEFVVQHGPDDVPHAAGLAADECGLIHTVDQDHDAFVAELIEDG